MTFYDLGQKVSFIKPQFCFGFVFGHKTSYWDITLFLYKGHFIASWTQNIGFSLMLIHVYNKSNIDQSIVVKTCCDAIEIEGNK